MLARVFAFEQVKDFLSSLLLQSIGICRDIIQAGLA